MKFRIPSSFRLSNLSNSSSISGLNPQTSRITEGAYIKGEVAFREKLHFAGKIDGSFIATTGDLELSASAEIHGDIQSRSVSSQGTIHGNIITTERIALRAESSLVGNIRSNILSIESGAAVSGSCSMFDGSKSFDFLEMPLEDLRHHLAGVLQKNLEGNKQAIEKLEDKKADKLESE